MSASDKDETRGLQPSETLLASPAVQVGPLIPALLTNTLREELVAQILVDWQETSKGILRAKLLRTRGEERS